jgi:pyrroline-5-carboxylate reductase
MSHVSTLRRKTIGIIGAGNMGQAILKGLLHAGMRPARLVVVESNRQRRKIVQRRYGVRVVSLQDIVILAVKPQDIAPVLRDFGRLLAHRVKKPLVISMAAGVRLASIERVVGAGVRVVRVMPNLAAAVGEGMAALTRGRFATAVDMAAANAVFHCVGDVVELPERLFDIVTAISGSGPAYFFLIFQALRDAGIRGGLPKTIAQRLAVQTAQGSARLASQVREELEALIARVASKKGTTEAALKVFHRRRLAQIIQAGVRAATARSRALST